MSEAEARRGFARWRCSIRPPALLMMTVVACALAGCEKQPELPPEIQRAESAAPMSSHTATLDGPERIVFANVAIEVHDASDSALSLTLTGRGANDEALLLTGNALARGGPANPKADPLADRTFEVTGPGKTYLGPTDGIKSMRSRYQVETAAIHIDRINGESASGRIDGTFWRFDQREPTLKPATQEQFSGSFTAKLIR